MSKSRTHRLWSQRATLLAAYGLAPLLIGCQPPPPNQSGLATEVAREVEATLTARAAPAVPTGTPIARPPQAPATGAPTDPAPTFTAGSCPNPIGWNEAKHHAGEFAAVSGPVVGANFARSTAGQPTFLDVGKRYPDPARFTILIWGRNRQNFSPSPEQTYFGRTVCVHGEITIFNDVAEIEAITPTNIVIIQ